MSELPDDPNELKAYVEQLLDDLKHKDERLRKSEQTVLELKQELNEQKEPGNGLDALVRALEALVEEKKRTREKLERMEGPSEESANRLDEATGYDGR
jgi:chromosome segregation ATPase